MITATLLILSLVGAAIMWLLEKIGPFLKSAYNHPFYLIWIFVAFAALFYSVKIQESEPLLLNIKYVETSIFIEDLGQLSVSGIYKFLKFLKLLTMPMAMLLLCTALYGFKEKLISEKIKNAATRAAYED